MLRFYSGSAKYLSNDLIVYLNKILYSVLGSEMFLKIGVVVGVLFIQLFFPKGTRTISRRLFLENFYSGLIAIPGFALGIDSKYLREYRCPTCRKLLAKGQLNHKNDILEVKCRGCATICLFSGTDAEIIQKRSELLREGLIPDPDKV